jgi:hypothetical protein
MNFACYTIWSSTFVTRQPGMWCRPSDKLTLQGEAILRFFRKNVWGGDGSVGVLVGVDDDNLENGATNVTLPTTKTANCPVRECHDRS